MKTWLDFIIAVICLFGMIVMWSVLKDPYGYSLSAKIGLKLFKLLGLIE